LKTLKLKLTLRRKNKDSLKRGQPLRPRESDRRNLRPSRRPNRRLLRGLNKKDLPKRLPIKQKLIGLQKSRDLPRKQLRRLRPKG